MVMMRSQKTTERERQPLKVNKELCFGASFHLNLEIFEFLSRDSKTAETEELKIKGAMGLSVAEDEGGIHSSFKECLSRVLIYTSDRYRNYNLLQAVSSWYLGLGKL